MKTEKRNETQIKLYKDTYDRIREIGASLNVKNNQDVMEVIVKEFDKLQKMRVETAKGKPKTGNDKFEIFFELIYNYNEKEAKNKTEQNYIYITSPSFIMNAIGVNRARIDENVKENMELKRDEQASRLEFTKAANLNPIIKKKIDITVGAKTKTSLKVVYEILRKSEYGILFGYDGTEKVTEKEEVK